MMMPLIAGIPNITPLQIGVAALPGYREALAEAEAADAWLQTPPQLPAVDPALAEHISDEWIDAERALETATADYEARRRIVQTRRERAASRAKSIFTAGVDLILGSLQHDLTTLLERAGKIIPELGGATTAAQAIDADAGTAWKRITELAEDYDGLRQAQTFVMLRGSVSVWQSSTPQFPGDDHANQAFLRNVDDLWPNWRQPGMSRSRIDLSDNARRARDEPWPADHGPRADDLARHFGRRAVDPDGQAVARTLGRSQRTRGRRQARPARQRISLRLAALRAARSRTQTPSESGRATKETGLRPDRTPDQSIDETTSRNTRRHNLMSALTSYQSGTIYPPIATAMLAKIAANLNPSDVALVGGPPPTPNVLEAIVDALVALDVALND